MALQRRKLPRYLSVLLFVATACTPVSKGYEIHTAELDCDEANRYVHDAVLGMDMVVTAFQLARPGRAGYLQAERTDARGTMRGSVDIRCDPDGVHIVADESGLFSEQEFGRGVFLGVTGRAGLVVEREGRGVGALVKRDATPSSAPAAAGGTGSAAAPASSSAGTAPSVASAPSAVAPAPARKRPKVRGVQVKLEPMRGFSTVLDFEADLSAVGILPVKVTVVNGTERVYDLDPRDIVLRHAGARDRVTPLTPSQAIDRLLGTNAEVVGSGGGQAGSQPAVGPIDRAAASELGDVGRAARIIPERELRAARLRPYDEVVGFLYFEVGDYDRARIRMIDVATGETEGFIVDF